MSAAKSPALKAQDLQKTLDDIAGQSTTGHLVAACVRMVECVDAIRVAQRLLENDASEIKKSTSEEVIFLRELGTRIADDRSSHNDRKAARICPKSEKFTKDDVEEFGFTVDTPVGLTVPQFLGTCRIRLSETAGDGTEYITHDSNKGNFRLPEVVIHHIWIRHTLLQMANKPGISVLIPNVVKAVVSKLQAALRYVLSSTFSLASLRTAGRLSVITVMVLLIAQILYKLGIEASHLIPHIPSMVMPISLFDLSWSGWSDHRLEDNPCADFPAWDVLDPTQAGGLVSNSSVSNRCFNGTIVEHIGKQYKYILDVIVMLLTIKPGDDILLDVISNVDIAEFVEKYKRVLHSIITENEDTHKLLLQDDYVWAVPQIYGGGDGRDNPELIYRTVSVDGWMFQSFGKHNEDLFLSWQKQLNETVLKVNSEMRKQVQYILHDNKVSMTKTMKVIAHPAVSDIDGLMEAVFRDAETGHDIVSSVIRKTNYGKTKQLILRGTFPPLESDLPKWSEYLRKKMHIVPLQQLSEKVNQTIVQVQQTLNARFDAEAERITEQGILGDDAVRCLREVCKDSHRDFIRNITSQLTAAVQEQQKQQKQLAEASGSESVAATIPGYYIDLITHLILQADKFATVTAHAAKIALGSPSETGKENATKRDDL